MGCIRSWTEFEKKRNDNIIKSITVQDIVTEQSRGEKGFLTAKPMHVEVVSEQTVKCKNLLSCLENDMACLTLIPCMLGMYFIEGTYATFFLDSLKSKFSVGVIGGKPNHALYFIGCKGNHLIHLDPHRVQDAYVNPSTKGAFTEPRKHSVPMTEIDTCCLMTFYTADRKELLELLEFLNGMQFEYGAATYPAFFLSDYDTLVKGGSAKKRPTAKGKQKRGEACRRAKCKARDGAEPRDDNNPPAPPQGEPAAAAGTGAELNESGDVNGLTDHNEEEATNAASELPTEDVKAWADKQSGQALSSSEPESA
ncbi:Cysteine protease atg4 [Diplonema papillatum]|nr:Cysteine protease atg4 [Diplonema papillatum]